MKKSLLFFTAIISLLLLAACGGTGEKTSSKGSSKMFEASLVDASFILLSKEGEYDPESDHGTVKLTINIKNTTKESIDILPEMDMHLYDGADQIDANPAIDSLLDMTYTANTSIGAGKQKTYTVLFDVEKEKEYELNIEPNLFSETQKVEPVTFKVDMSQYSDSYDTLTEPVEALQAYIETIYFDKKHDNLEELMNVDLDKRMKEAEKGFSRFIKDATYQDVEEKRVSEFYEHFTQVLKEKGEIEVLLKGNSDEKAYIEVRYAGISSGDVGEEYNKVRQSYLDKLEVYNREEAEEYAVSKLNTIISQSKVAEGRNPLDIYMVKKDGKWSFENKYGDTEQSINDIFASGRIR